MRNLMKAFGLSLLAALCLTAFMASSASAQLINHGKFLLASGTFPATETVTGREVVKGAGSLLILELGLFLKCENTVVSNGVLAVLGTGKASIKFEDCHFYDDDAGVPGAKNEACDLFDIETNVSAQVFLHGTAGHPYVRFSPLTGTVFAIGPECGLIPESEIKGTVVAEVVNPLTHAVKPRLRVDAGILELFATDTLFYGLNEGHLKVEAELELTGANLGKAWGVT